METAATVNSIVLQTAEALQTQKAVNTHLKERLMLLNQRIDILQEEIDMLYQLHNVICQSFYKAVCVSSSPFSRLQNISHNLSDYLQSPWNAKFVNFSYQLTKQILRINDTRVKITSWQDFLSSLSEGLNLVKSWSSSVAIIVLIRVILI